MLIDVRLDQFLNIKISQGGVATRLRCDGVHYTITAESDSVKNLKIGQNLPKLWAIKYRFFFMKHGA